MRVGGLGMKVGRVGDTCMRSGTAGSMANHLTAPDCDWLAVALAAPLCGASTSEG
jgi:hypothetical protein